MPRSLIRANQLNDDVFADATSRALVAVQTILIPVYQTGNQYISGQKIFDVLPGISGGYFVATTGNQTIGGIKTFISPIYSDQFHAITGNSYISLLNGQIIDNLSQISIDYNKHQLTGVWNFQFQPTLSGADFVLTTGGQIIGGNKSFIGSTTFSGAIRAGLILGSNSVANVAANFNTYQLIGPGTVTNLDWSGRFLTGGNWSTNTIPTSPLHIVNKNYLDTNIVNTTGNQDITGEKVFSNPCYFESGLNLAGGPFVFGSPEDGPYLIYNAGNSLGIDFQLGALKQANFVYLDWGNKILSGLWTTQQFQISSSGAPISYYNSGRATFTTGVATVSFPNLTDNVNLLYNMQFSSGTPGFLSVNSRQNGVGFNIQSSSALHSGVVFWEAKL